MNSKQYINDYLKEHIVKDNNANNISRRVFIGNSIKAGLAGAVGMALPFFNKISKGGDEVVYKVGKLNLYNEIADIGGYWPLGIIHRPGALEEFEGDYGYDSLYNSGPPDKPNTKVVSTLQTQEGKEELDLDSRPLESFSSVNLELSVDTGGGNIDISCANNIMCSIDPNNKGYDFGAKPITLWRRFPAEPDKLQFLADVREALARNNFIGPFGFKYTRIPLPDLNGRFGNQVPYEFLQVRFDVYPGNLNFSLDQDGRILDGIVDMKDLPYLGEDWGKKGAPLDYIADITGEKGIPDGNVDSFDLELFVRHWLKNIRDIMP